MIQLKIEIFDEEDIDVLEQMLLKLGEMIGNAD